MLDQTFFKDSMKFTNLLATAAILLCYTSASHADGWIAIGSAPAADGGGTSLAIATKGESNWGLGIGFIFNAEFASKDILDYPVPHSSYTNLGTKRTSSAFGGDVYYFFGDSPNVRPYVGLGVYFAPKKEVAQSNITGWYYNQQSQTSTNLAAEVGIQMVSEKGYTFGAGFHSIRGANIIVGKAF